MHPCLEERSKQFPGEMVLASGEQDEWFWFCGMSASELEDWWVAQKTFESTPEPEVIKALYEAFGEPVPPQHHFEAPGHFFPVSSEDELKLWTTLSEGNTHYRCILWLDSQSFLMRPDGMKLYHASGV